MKNKAKYACTCGNTEFITQPNRYEVYEADGDYLVFQKDEDTDEKPVLRCRECGKKLKFDMEDVK